MAQYVLVDPATGKMHKCHGTRLHDLLHVNQILFREKEHIGIITARNLISYNRWLAGRIMSAHSSNHFPASRRALALVDQWLNDPESIDKNQLADAGWEARSERHLSWTAARSAENTAGATATLMEIGPFSAAGVLRKMMVQTSNMACAIGVSTREQLEQLVNIVQAE